ncbi:MAG: signal peptidase II [Clostridia bacterium]|nr:signal peptidase II [Clostridia bacterium]
MLAALIGLDQVTKFFAARDKVQSVVIDDFFYLSYSTNTGAGFSFLADKEWGQILFKILTPFALVAFLLVYLFALKKSYKWLSYSVVLMVAGTIGNFIDRLLNGAVVDFLSFKFGSYYFPTFNVADICLTVGVIMVIFHFLFLDANALFAKKQTDKENGNT